MGALDSLAQMKSEKAAGPVDELEAKHAENTVREKAYDVLLALGPAAEGPLLKRLDAPEPARRLRAYAGLKDSKSPAVLEAVLADRDRKSTRLNSSHTATSRMPSSA